ncbi:hypothetical protein OYC64_016034 [Pagothenia borchgrevinki]|uniref:Uncharacterized protein n=1 Tax=Pagothenia borchgrevinki TaxID=8213 RepID=A0ABD2HI80_PAGBO
MLAFSQLHKCLTLEKEACRLLLGRWRERLHDCCGKQHLCSRWSFCVKGSCSYNKIESYTLDQCSIQTTCPHKEDVPGVFEKQPVPGGGARPPSLNASTQTQKNGSPLAA